MKSMKTRKWLKFYDEAASVEAGLIPDEGTVSLRMENYGLAPDVLIVQLTPEEARELAEFLCEIAKDLE